MKLFVDMDGTLARFHDEEGWPERMYEKGFFEVLAPFEDVVKALGDLSRNPDLEIFILSTVLPTNYCAEEKKTWIKRFLPFIKEENMLFVPPTHRDGSRFSKADFFSRVERTDVLLDDYSLNLVEWETAGGTGIKLLNNINGKGTKGPRFTGAFVKFDDSNLTNILWKIIQKTKG